MKILLIDDDMIIHKVINHNLTEEGHTVYSAMSGEQAQKFLQLERDVDVIICDMMMPGISGSEFIDHLKNYYSKWMPSVIVISSLDEGNELMKRSGIKFNYFIHKPFEMSYLTGVLEHIMNSKKPNRQN